MKSENVYLVHSDTLELSVHGLIWFFTELSVNESDQINKYISKKKSMSYNVDVSIGHNDWPLMQLEEKILQGPNGLLIEWKTKYLSLLKYDSISTICDEYLRGIQWNWSYYIGKNVCFNWYYSFSLPPLWEWLRDHLTTHSMPENKILLLAKDICPVEQLTLVLPLESWSLIPPCPEKKFPIIAPQFYPSSFTFESVGKRFFWECEAMIPMPSIVELKEIISYHNI
jgi:5'-3' exonuclease